MGKAAANLKQMRIIHFSFLLALVLWVLVAEQNAGKNRNGLAALFLYSMTATAGLYGLIGYYFQRTRVTAALEKLVRNPENPEALLEWRKFTITSLVLALSIGLQGFALRFLGTGRPISVLFYLAALILLLLWTPKLDLPMQPPPSENQ